jgi:YgiT-type zinc finger domain-containing protein
MMKCAVAGCPGEYKERRITQFFTRGGQAIVVEDIPAEVCDVCGDTLLAPEVVEQLVKIDVREKEPVKFAPVFKYKVMAGI